MRGRTLSALAALVLASALVAPSRGQDAPLGVAGALDDPDGRVGAALRAALAATSTGRTTRLVFWGASHTASDQYTAPIRARLRRRFGDAGSGLLMPAQPFWLYEMRDFDVPEVPAFEGRFVRGTTRVPGAYGRAGFALDVDRAASTTLVPRRGVRFASVTLWAEARAGGGTVTLAVDGHEASLDTSQPTPSGFGEVRLDVPLGSHPIEVRAHGDGPVRIFGVLPETGTGGVTVEAFGVPGARARDWAPWDEAALRAQLAARPADLVAIAYGTNESGDGTALATVEARLEATLGRLSAVAPGVSCLVIGPSDRPRLRGERYVPRPRSTAMAELFHRRALAHGCAFFDTLAWQGGAGSMIDWVARGLALDDHVHLTDAGYEQMAGALLEGLGL